MRVRQLVIDMDEVDAVLRQFDPDIDREMIRRKPVPPRHTAFSGQISDIMLRMLRETGLPLTAKDIALRVVIKCGLNAANSRLMWCVYSSTAASLRHLCATKLVRSSPGRGSNVRRELVWQPMRLLADGFRLNHRVIRLEQTGARSQGSHIRSKNRLPRPDHWKRNMTGTEPVCGEPPISS